MPKLGKASKKMREAEPCSFPWKGLLLGLGRLNGSQVDHEHGFPGLGGLCAGIDLDLLALMVSDFFNHLFYCKILFTVLVVGENKSSLVIFGKDTGGQ